LTILHIFHSAAVGDLVFAAESSAAVLPRFVR